MGAGFKCPDVGQLPGSYSDKLPKGVPVDERPSTKGVPAEVTWYFPIALTQTNPTGVFLPKGFGYPRELDVILFFHGNKQGLWDTINQYWHGDIWNITLRENVNDSGKNAVLVAPTMGLKPGFGGINNADIGIFGQTGGAGTASWTTS
jgi:hypothetical protein